MRATSSIVRLDCASDARGWIRGLSAASMTFVALSAMVGSAAAEPLRYGWPSNAVFQYHTEITAESGQDVIKYQGHTRYQVGAGQNEQLFLTYSGMLHESRLPKPQAVGRIPRPPFGPRGFGGPPGFPDPFSRARFGGLSPSSNQITLTPNGGIISLKGDSQLPYLLGNLSLLPFEVFPEKDEPEWTIDSGVSISKPGDDSRRPFRSFGPFSDEAPKAVQSGRETARYKIESRDDKQVVVKKSYQLSSAKTNEEAGFDITGSGVWTFDLEQHITRSIDYSQKLVIHQDNVDVTVPISIKIRLLSSDEIAKLEADAKVAAEAHKQRLEEMQRKKEAPLTEEEKHEAVAGLTASDPTEVLESLKKLRERTPKEPDADVLALLNALLASRNKKVQADAQETLALWSPDYKKRFELNKAYAGHMPVDSTNKKVTRETPLFIGQIVQVQPNRAFWHAAEIIDLLPDGRVMVQTRGIGARELRINREDLQLAPDNVDQPTPKGDSPVADVARSTGNPATPAPKEEARPEATVKPILRTWTNHTGDYKVEAEFLGQGDGKVRLRRKDGKEVAVPLDRLSKEDQEFLKSQPKVENPFE